MIEMLAGLAIIMTSKIEEIYNPFIWIMATVVMIEGLIRLYVKIKQE